MNNNKGGLLGLMLLSALAHEQNNRDRYANGGYTGKGGPGRHPDTVDAEMPAALPEGVSLTDTFRILKNDRDGAQCLVHRKKGDDGMPCIELTLAKPGTEPLTLLLAYTATRLRDIDFFRFDGAMVGAALDQSLAALADLPCTCGQCP